MRIQQDRAAGVVDAFLLFLQLFQLFKNLRNQQRARSANKVVASALTGPVLVTVEQRAVALILDRVDVQPLLHPDELRLRGVARKLYLLAGIGLKGLTLDFAARQLIQEMDAQ